MSELNPLEIVGLKLTNINLLVHTIEISIYPPALCLEFADVLIITNYTEIICNVVFVLFFVNYYVDWLTELFHHKYYVCKQTSLGK